MSGSGSRLPGDYESNDRHKAEERAEARLSGTLAERFTSHVDAHGAAKSEVVRNALDEYLPDAEHTPYLAPQDPKLSKAYLALACEEKRIISIEEAKDELSESTFPSTGKEVIEDGVLRPLGDTPFMAVQWGRVAVHPLTRMDDLDGGSDD
ncbi:hypothetical protein [Haloarcula sp. CBA1129]|uniref:hypothetical protein n=1 Tax=Haloarcula sp. CBA1129 TaxID=1853684 RepID=UPI0012472AEA|nr:hypothetical protein [Haloarcula sp. CBA1129]KAA9399665.1 hypothetical protein Har1129_16145 [Haloarcula sp. CBA1129]